MSKKQDIWTPNDHNFGNWRWTEEQSPHAAWCLYAINLPQRCGLARTRREVYEVNGRVSKKKQRWARGAAIVALFTLLATAHTQQSPASPSAPLQWTPAGLRLKGQPFQIVSGEMEYVRIPRADWRDRLRKARAMGLNAITVYVFWDVHEPTPGVYDFSGQNDVAEFLREAQEEGLYVILRPGPYVCAEWDLGGYPAWLLKDHTMELRSLQPQFMTPVTRWMHRLGQELAPLQASEGGPILAVQVENEYGSFGKDHAYMERMLALVRESGFTSSLLYTADGADMLEAGSLPGMFAAIDFGTGDAARSLALLRKRAPQTPVYVAEYWDGWFDHWGERHQTTDAAVQEAEIRSMLAEGDSLSLYMVHGGTSFGWNNGANSDGKTYQPDVSSYDYDAPLDESGRPRPKYFAIRQIIADTTHRTPPPVPESAPAITLPAIPLTHGQSLWSGLPRGVTSPDPLSMEDLGQNYGYVLYRTQVQHGGTGELAFHALHSYARVYANGALAGVADRRLGQQSVALTLKAGDRLDVLVENSGRINFTTALRGERAGLTGAVTFAGEPLQEWQNVALPFAPPPAVGYSTTACDGPCLYREEFIVAKPGDTYLNTERLTKGVIWVNGHPLGRFWNVGPMGDLFLPGAWLQPGRNEITVLDLQGGTGLSVAGQQSPTYIAPRTAEAAAQP